MAEWIDPIVALALEVRADAMANDDFIVAKMPDAVICGPGGKAPRLAKDDCVLQVMSSVT